jgi:hypothetical protein
VVGDASESGLEVDGGAGGEDSEGPGVAYGAAERLEVATLASDPEPVAASSARAALAGAGSEASRRAEDWRPAAAAAAGGDASVEATGTSVEATGAFVAGAGASVAATAEASSSAPAPELAEPSRSPFPGVEPAEPAATIDPPPPTDGPDPPGWAVGGASGADPGGTWSPTRPGGPATSGRGVTRTRAGVPM